MDILVILNMALLPILASVAALNLVYILFLLDQYFHGLKTAKQVVDFFKYNLIFLVFIALLLLFTLKTLPLT